MTKKRIRKPPEPHWIDAVQTFYKFCNQHFNENPSFDGSAPRDLKEIIISLRKRAEDKQVEWTSQECTTRLWAFLKHAFNDSWLRQNFIL